MNLGTLVSETRNPQTMDLDALSTQIGRAHV